MNKVDSIEGKKVYCSNAYNAQKNRDEQWIFNIQNANAIPGYVFFIVNGWIELRRLHWKWLLLYVASYESKHFCFVADEHVFLWLLLPLNKLEEFSSYGWLFSQTINMDFIF